MNIKTIVLLILIIATSLFPKLYGRGYEPSKKVYYICFDNSWSMKRYDFYPRLMGFLWVNLKREGLDEEIEIKYVPFGTRWAIKEYKSYGNFSDYISKKTFSTTDFVNLSKTLDRMNDGNTVIIISDGEHDTSTHRPFSNLKLSELEDMLNVVQKMRRKNLNVYSIHILKGYSHIGSKDIGYYYNSLKKSNVMGGMELSVTKGNIIAELSMDFMKKLASSSSNYHLCEDNKDAVRALFNILDISPHMDCDASGFMNTIPIAVTFSSNVGRDTMSFLHREIQTYTFCIQGIHRSFELDRYSKFFQLDIEHHDNDVYTAVLGDQTIWKQRRIYSRSDIKNFLDRVKDRVESKIKNEFSDNPRFALPECYLSIKFQDKKLYAFISDENFKMSLENCGKNTTVTPELSFFDEDQRAYVFVPVKVARSLTVTSPAQGTDGKKEKTFSFTSANIGSWDAGELEVQTGDLDYPKITYDFSGFFSDPNARGDLLFFSSDTKRFFGLVNYRGQKNLELFLGRKYDVYFVPENIEKKNIKSFPKVLSNIEDISKVLELVKPTDEDVVFNDWEECLLKFRNAAKSDRGHEGKKDIVTRQIVESNGYFHLLNHLGYIVEDEEYKRIFKELLDNTISLYKGMGTPFKVIDLLQYEIPGFSQQLMRKYLELMGHQGKAMTTIQLLSNPNQNLIELKYYIDGDLLGRVTKQNHKYFKALEEY